MHPQKTFVKMDYFWCILRHFGRHLKSNFQPTTECFFFNKMYRKKKQKNFISTDLQKSEVVSSCPGNCGTAVNSHLCIKYRCIELFVFDYGSLPYLLFFVFMVESYFSFSCSWWNSERFSPVFFQDYGQESASACCTSSAAGEETPGHTTRGTPQTAESGRGCYRTEKN